LRFLWTARGTCAAPRDNLDNADNMGDAAPAPTAPAMSNHSHIILLGARCSGKSTVGRLLAQRLARPFIDLDERTLEQFSEPSIAAAWHAHGEARWREAEAHTLDSLLRQAGASHAALVLALGGGTPIIPQARECLLGLRERREAALVYLQCSAATLRQRLQQASEAGLAARPPLMGSNAIDEVAQVLAAREPVYLQLASVVIAGDDAPGRVVDRTLEALAGAQS
jgi:shikimate kinase